MSEEEQTVARNCLHTDCIYRGQIDGGHTPICMYALIEGRARGCEISKCNKYRSGKKVKAKMRSDVIIYWEMEYYDRTDADTLS